MYELIGKTIGQYHILGLLGEGRMSTVFRARQSAIGRDVALKVIETKLSRDSEYLKRFEREVQIIASLDHPHILKVFDFGQRGNLLYLVTEIKPSSLYRMLRSKPLNLDQAQFLFGQITHAVDYAHHKNVIHRDLKPHNIFIDESGNAVIADFGIAKWVDKAHQSLTQVGTVMGTPNYMSPEQWRGRELDGRSDIYALGVMLYEMLTGEIPFNARSTPELMYMHLHESPPRLPLKSLPGLPALDEVIAQAMAKSPEDRFESAAAMYDAFCAARKGVMPSQPPKPTPLPAFSQATIISSGGNSTTVVDLPPPSRTPRIIGGLASIAITLTLVLGAFFVVSGNSSFPNNSLPDQDPLPTTSQLLSQPNILLSATTAPTATAYPSEAPNALFELLGTATAIYETLEAELKNGAPSPTPTVDVLGTAIAGVTATITAATAQSQATQTATTWTDTPTPTLQPSATTLATELPSNTPTHVPTNTVAATPTPVAPKFVSLSVLRNADWTPIQRTFDGVPMLLVPKGCFKMGSDSSGVPEEAPAHLACVDRAFWMDKYEVTNAQFNRFSGLASRKSSNPHDNHPREQITLLEARAFCQLRGARLPSELEWEYAARGPDSLLYPWGNDFITENIFYDTHSHVVGQRVQNVSWVGVYDLLGNVWEWTDSKLYAYPYQAWDGRENTSYSTDRQVIRGSSWVNDNTMRATARGQAFPDRAYPNVGFRCVRDY
ncbi:MAG: hypothetical protein OHK0023_07120 [Anaerolineae bacterium]